MYVVKLSECFPSCFVPCYTPWFFHFIVITRLYIWFHIDVLIFIINTMIVFLGINETCSSDGDFLLLDILQLCNRFKCYDHMWIDVPTNRTWILPNCLIVLNDKLHTMSIYITCTNTVLCCTGWFHFCVDNFFIQISYLWWYYYRFGGNVSVCLWDICSSIHLCFGWVKDAPWNCYYFQFCVLEMYNMVCGSSQTMCGKSNQQNF